MNAFYCLSPNMQKVIWQMKWTRLQPIQEKAIPAITQTDRHIVLCAGTASGKTEAAFLPILSLVEETAKNELNVLYISPLKALINNQFERIERLCNLSNITVHRWHGDVTQNAKKKLLKQPSGILQITPESIESLFLNRTSNLQSLFSNLKFIIIDEIHAFLDSERGVHLQSLLHRLKPFCVSMPRIIGLSATIGDSAYVQRWLDPVAPENVDVIDGGSSGKELLYSLMHFPSKSPLKPVELYEDIRQITKDKKSIIFCNSRGGVEEACVMLNRLVSREGVGETYYPHHSSMDKKERERVEDILASADEPKSVVSTSTLELGIDIGNVDLVIQIDSTFTVSSLKQRLGRSGRRENTDQMLQLYSTNDDSLLQSIAVMELLREGWVEPNTGYSLPYDILLQQMISYCHQVNGASDQDLLKLVEANPAFVDLNLEDSAALIRHLVDTDILERIRGSNELIVGLEGERLLRSKDFYAAFMTVEQLHVHHGNREIGRLDVDPHLKPGDNIILAGRLWSIQNVDFKRLKVYVHPAVDAKPPNYSSGGGALHPKIAQKMFDILCDDDQPIYIDEVALSALTDMRHKYRLNHVNSHERIVWRDGDGYVFETFAGTIISQTLLWMMRGIGVPVGRRDYFGRITLNQQIDINEVVKALLSHAWSTDDVYNQVQEHERMQSKYMPYLPEPLAKKIHLAHQVNIDDTIRFLREPIRVI